MLSKVLAPEYANWDYFTCIPKSPPQIHTQFFLQALLSFSQGSRLLHMKMMEAQSEEGRKNTAHALNVEVLGSIPGTT